MMVKRIIGGKRARFVQSLLLASVLGGSAHANPVGPKVVHGNAAFSQAGGQLTITNSNGAIIEWEDFSIGADEITRFIQENDLSSVLNRVTTSNPSEIFGQLLSNGRVFVINPNGIVFGADSRIDTAGLVASTLDISDANFIAGNYHFSGDGGAIVNQGFIKVGKGGHVVLIAPDIENTGIIQSEGGDCFNLKPFRIGFADQSGRVSG